VSASGATHEKRRSWKCPVHRIRMSWYWAFRLVKAKPERMLTITNVPKEAGVAHLAFQRLIRDLRKVCGEFQYCRFLEVTERGMYHYHIAQKGAYVPQRKLSELAEKNGFGKIVDIRKINEGGGAAWYMAKYVTKESVPDGWKKVAASRTFFLPEGPQNGSEGQESGSWSEDEWVVLPDDVWISHGSVDDYVKACEDAGVVVGGDPLGRKWPSRMTATEKAMDVFAQQQVKAKESMRNGRIMQ